MYNVSTGFRLGRCKREAGNLDGLPKIRKVTHSVTLVVTGKPENRGTGNLAQISLARFRLTKCSIKWLRSATALISFTICFLPLAMTGLAQTIVFSLHGTVAYR